MNPLRSLALVSLLGLLSLQSAQCLEFEQEIAGKDISPDSTVAFSESRVGGGGAVTTDHGKLKVEVSPGRSHFYNLASEESYNAALPEGSTIELGLKVDSEENSQGVFSIRFGTGEASWQAIFYPDKIQIGSTLIPHDCREPDTYRFAFKENAMSFYSGRGGMLASDVRPELRYTENRISFGTRRLITVSTPLVWELEFIRWTNKKAEFSQPETTAK